MNDYSKYLKLFDTDTYISVSNFSLRTHIAYSDCTVILDNLVQGNYLKKEFAIRCPECGMFLKAISHREDAVVTDAVYCAHCDENIRITDECIEVIYKRT